LPDLIEVPRVHRGYPTEKPVQVSDVLIGQSSAPGEAVVDPFLGAGGVGVAAVGQGRDFWGNDIRQRALDISRERIAAAGAEIVDEPACFRRERALREPQAQAQPKLQPQLGLALSR
jgi:site-specific DNA-methyltransferase (adenine-specific)